MTATITETASDSNDVFRNIEQGQEELDSIKSLSDTTMDVSKRTEADMNELLSLNASLNSLHTLGFDPIFSRDERTCYLYTNWMRQAYEGWVKSIRGMIDSKQSMPVPTKMEEYVHGRAYALLTPNNDNASLEQHRGKF